jgi:ABC-2 type transport system permease protein
MFRLLSTIKKESLILMRDRAGLGVLFVMPMALVLVVTLVQDSAFKAVRETEIKLIYLDNDRGVFGLALEKVLNEAGNFSLTKKLDGKEVDEKILREKVAKGDFQIGIIVPEGAGREIQEKAGDLIEKMISATSMSGSGNPGKESQPLEIEIHFDPAIRKSFRNSVVSSLNRFIAHIEKTAILDIISGKFSVNRTVKEGEKDYLKSMVEIKEIYAVPESSGLTPNAVQQNVPAWTMFAIFFICIPLAGNMIKERNDGISVRLRTMPGSYLTHVLGKIIVYLCVCMIQFVLMLLVGVYILPMLGTEILEMGSDYGAMMLMAVSSGLAATGFGVMLGTLATTHEQASTFGAISVVVAAALGGVMVPVFVMPEIMQKVSVMSPLSWGLNGFLDIFLREGNLFAVLPDAMKLLIFFMSTLLISHLRNKFMNLG